MRRSAVLLASVVVLTLAVPGLALAYDEIGFPASTYDSAQRTPPLPPGSYYAPHGTHWDTNCASCHGPFLPEACPQCHGAASDPAYGNAEGPHGYYTSATRFCVTCHTGHDAAGPELLLAASMTANCNTCHDGTGGQGVYGSIMARLGTPASGGHSIDATNIVPGGSGTTGGSSTMSFGGVGGSLTCADCHTPHGSNTVAPFTGERANRPFWLNYGKDATSTHMLKQRPGNAPTAVAVYGSDWCLACHAGRASGGMVNSHPVDSSVVRPNPYNYSSLPISSAALGSTAPRTTTIVAPMNTFVTVNALVPWLIDPNQLVNRTLYISAGGAGYVMAYPRTAQQSGHGPICQQCHEDARDPGSLDANGAMIVNWTRIYGADGLDPADNPRFQNFPHETENANMTIETGDDLCLNCHPPGFLP